MTVKVGEEFISSFTFMFISSTTPWSAADCPTQYHQAVPRQRRADDDASHAARARQAIPRYGEAAAASAAPLLRARRRGVRATRWRARTRVLNTAPTWSWRGRSGRLPSRDVRPLSRWLGRRDSGRSWTTRSCRVCCPARASSKGVQSWRAPRLMSRLLHAEAYVVGRCRTSRLAGRLLARRWCRRRRSRLRRQEIG